MVKVEIIAVGGELLANGARDSNSDYISEWAARNGFVVRFRTIVGDYMEDLIDVIGNALRRAQLIMITGGLGPTWDDVTRRALADAVKRELTMIPDALQAIMKSYQSRGIHPDGKEETQAMMPLGSQWLENPVGIAPGILFQTDTVTVVSLPGVPSEMRKMVDNLTPETMFLFPHEPRYEIIRKIKIIGKREREVEQQLGDAVKQPEIEFSILPGMRWIELGLKSRGNDRSELDNILNTTITKIRGLLGDDVFCVGEQNLEDVVAMLLIETGKTVGTAESCTGGLLGYRLTSVSGSSEYFHKGVITYSNEAKQQVLGVSAGTLAQNGAVSADTAAEMAHGIRKLAGSHIGVSVTGIAGPTGGTPDKPVGTVFFGLDSEQECFTKKRLFSGTREQIRVRAADTALDLIRRHLLLLNRNSSNT